MDTITGGQLVAQALHAQGVDVIFTLSGGHITPIYQFLENAPIRLFDTRHEQAAVFMAEAWGKMTRTPGVAMVTAGPGFTNAMTGVASARFSNTPLVIIAGAVGLDCREKLDLQDMPQEAVIAPMVKKTFVCLKASRIPEYVDLAFRTAAAGRPGPVYLEFPVDVLGAAVPVDQARVFCTRAQSAPVDMDKVEAALELLGKAHKPVVVAGTGVWQAGAEADLTAFAEAAGLPVFTSLSARGAISDTHPLCFEGALALRPGAAFGAYVTADLVLVIGTRISLYYIFGDIFNPAAKIVQVDIAPEEIGRNRPVDLPVVGDAGAFLRACTHLIGQRGMTADLQARFAPWIEEVRAFHSQGKAAAQADWQSAKVPIHPLRLAKEIDEYMSRDDDFVVADGGDTTTWMGMTRTLRHAGRYLDYGLFGSLAVGLPYANAAKLRYPASRVLLLTGDGSVGFNFMEFETAIRKNLPIVVVINNDLGWGMIRHSQEIKIGHAIETGTFIGRVDYHKLVEALGGAGFLVERPEDIRPALEAAFASGKTACVNVMTDPTVVSPASMALANIGAYKA